MVGLLPPLRLTGAQILRDGKLQQRSVAIRGGRLTKGPLPAVDLRGFLVLPGIVDLHAPLRLPGGARERAGDLEAHFSDLDREAASQGVTTRYLSQPWAWNRGESDPGVAETVARVWADRRSGSLTDLRLQIRCDTHMTDTGERLLALLRETGADLVIFEALTEEADRRRQADPAAFAEWCQEGEDDSVMSPAALDARLARAPEVPRFLCRMAEAFDALGVLYGSAADLSAEAREHMSMIGARLCLMPATARAAAVARAVGDPVLAAAGDLLLAPAGRPRPRTLDLVTARLCDALVSGDMSGSMAPAAWRLADMGVMPFETAWRLISELPARLMRLPDRGVIGPGKRADLAIVNASTRQVEATISAGRLVYMSGAVIERFLEPNAETHQIAAE